MKYAIVCSSKTGNTASLAESIKSVLPGQDLIYCGEPDKKAYEADFIFAGFWTDKGTCDSLSEEFLKGLKNRNVFLFGTAGFGGSKEYFGQILKRVSENLSSDNVLKGAFMCQGKMPQTVRSRYEKLAETDPAKGKMLIENFDKALSHPDGADFENLKKAVLKFIET